VTSRLKYAEVVAMLNRFSPPGDASDPKPRTRARILRSAATLFEQRGYQRTSIDDVARESGIAKGTVYVHFKSKSELLFHVFIEEKKRLVERFQSLFSEELAAEERLRRYLTLALVSLCESPLTHRLLTGDREFQLFIEELPTQLREQMLAQQPEGLAALLEGVGHFSALTPEERKERLAAFQGLLFTVGHLMEARTRTGLDAETYARQLARILVDGIGAP
jgi:AcrR family transcriptional regulator